MPTLSPTPAPRTSDPAFGRSAAWALGLSGLLLLVVPHALVAAGVWELDALLMEASFYVIAGLYAATAGVFLALWRDESALARFVGREKKALLAVALLTAGLFAVVGPGYRVLSDETNLLSVSKSMLRDKTIANNVMAYYYLDIFHHVKSVTDKRPFAYPFAVFLAHVTTGYRWQNLFLVNGLVTAATLALAYLAFRWRRTRVNGAAAVALCAAQPVFLICATSGGFEPLALFWQLASYVALLAFIRRPHATLYFALLASWLMFINTRYESIAAVAVMAGGMLAGHKPFRAHVARHWWAIPWCVVFAAPVFWLFKLKGDDQETKDGAKAFALEYLPNHASDLWAAFTKLDFYYPFAPLVTFAVLALALWALGRRFLGGEGGHPGPTGGTDGAWRAAWRSWFPWALIAASLVVQTLIYLLYHAGSAEYPYTVRYFLPLAVMTGLAGLLCAETLRLKPAHALGFAVAAYVLYMPVVLEDKLMNSLELQRATKRVYRFLADKPKRETLVVVDRPGQYVVLDMGAINFRQANREIDKYQKHMRERTFSQVYAVQDVDVDTLRVTDETKLDPRYALTPLYEVRASSAKILRISRVEIAPTPSPADEKAKGAIPTPAPRKTGG